jgi:hypothetical protein
MEEVLPTARDVLKADAHLAVDASLKAGTEATLSTLRTEIERETQHLRSTLTSEKESVKKEISNQFQDLLRSAISKCEQHCLAVFRLHSEKATSELKALVLDAKRARAELSHQQDSSAPTSELTSLENRLMSQMSALESSLCSADVSTVGTGSTHMGDIDQSSNLSNSSSRGHSVGPLGTADSYGSKGSVRIDNLQGLHKDVQLLASQVADLQRQIEQGSSGVRDSTSEPFESVNTQRLEWELQALKEHCTQRISSVNSRMEEEALARHLALSTMSKTFDTDLRTLKDKCSEVSNDTSAATTRLDGEVRSLTEHVDNKVGGLSRQFQSEITHRNNVFSMFAKSIDTMSKEFDRQAGQTMCLTELYEYLMRQPFIEGSDRDRFMNASANASYADRSLSRERPICGPVSAV